MLRRDAFLLTAILTLALAGCAPITVGSHRSSDADFARYHTFAWTDADALPVGDPRLDSNPFFQDYLQGAIERRLHEHGLTLAGPADEADLVIHYHATVAQRVDVTRDHPNTPNAYTEPEIIASKESTIVLDITDARTHRLVWRGWAQDSLDAFVNDQDRMRAHIEESVARMLRLLPM
jgi:hypothetical protein